MCECLAAIFPAQHLRLEMIQGHPEKNIALVSLRIAVGRYFATQKAGVPGSILSESMLTGIFGEAAASCSTCAIFGRSLKRISEVPSTMNCGV